MSIINKKKLVLITISLTLVFLLTSCSDLGNVEDINEYYEIFDDIEVFYANSNHSYDMDEFYNEDTVNKMDSPMDKAEYCQYISIHVKRSVDIGDFAMFVYGEADTSLVVNIFAGTDKPEDKSVDNDSPIYDTFTYNSGSDHRTMKFEKNSDDKNVMTYTDNGVVKTAGFTISDDKNEAYFTLTAGDGIPHEYKCTITYKGLVVEDTTSRVVLTFISSNKLYIMDQTTLSLTKGTWSSFSFTNFLVDGIPQSAFSIDDQWIIIQFENNCEIGRFEGLSNVKIKLTNIMIRVEK